MNEKPTILTEHVADIPMLLAQMDRIGLVEVLDAHVPIHDNWQELSCGRVTTVWLSSILSRGDHRLVPVAFDMTPTILPKRFCWLYNRPSISATR